MSSSKKYNIVVTTSRFPYPLEKGDKLRAFFQIKELAKSFNIHLLSISDKEIEPNSIKELEKYCADVKVYVLPKWKSFLNTALSIFSNKPFQVGYFYSRKINKAIQTYLTDLKPDHIYCQLLRSAEYVKDYHDCSKTIDYMDALSKGIERRIDKAKWFEKWFYVKEHKRLVIYESLLFDFFENKTIISEQDRDLIFHKDRKKISVIPNGVGPSFFEEVAIEKKFDLLFTGNMSYPPNIEAAEILINQILPKLKTTHKQVSVLISGTSPHQRVLDLASNNVTISGWVDDIRESYASSKVFIAPMFIGTGLQNKLLEAMAMKMPCITTNLANNALQATAGDNIFIANSIAEFVDKIDNLLASPESQDSTGKSACQFVQENYQWNVCTAPLIQLIENDCENTDFVV